MIPKYVAVGGSLAAGAALAIVAYAALTAPGAKSMNMKPADSSSSQADDGAAAPSTACPAPGKVVGGECVTTVRVTPPADRVRGEEGKDETADDPTEAQTEAQDEAGDDAAEAQEEAADEAGDDDQQEAGKQARDENGPGSGRESGEHEEDD